MAVPADADRELALADEALATFQVDAAVAHLSAAVRILTEAQQPRLAAMASVRLGEVMGTFLGNSTAARAWFARAWRLVEHEPVCVEQGWVAVAPMGCEVPDPADLLRAAELALDRARRFGDVNLETKALADAGLAHVQAGRLATGMALLDEAMALACGPADPDVNAAKAICSFYTACYHTADFERAGTWTDLLHQRGLIGSTPVFPLVLSNHCDSVQATLLIELGRWGDAEAVLLRAKSEFEAAVGPSWHPAIALADLRTRQGRFSEAEALLLGKDHAIEAVLPLARLQLARGDLELARATIGRGLRAMHADAPRAAELLAVLVDVELASGRVEQAAAASAELDVRIGPLDLPVLRAHAAVAQARVLAAAGDVADAVASVEQVVDPFDQRLLAWPRARLLLELARLREQAGHLTGRDARPRSPPRPSSTASTSCSRSTTSGCSHAWSDKATKRRRRAGIASLARQGRWWVACFEGTSVRLPDSKGLRYLAELVARPGQERHALDLVDRIEGPAPADGVRPGINSATRVRCSTGEPARRTATGSRSCAARSTTPSPTAGSSGPRPPSSSSTRSCGSWPGRSASVAATVAPLRPPNGLVSTSHAPCGPRRPGWRRDAGGWRRPRPGVAHRALLHLHPRSGGSGPLDRSVLTERERRPLNAEGVWTPCRPPSMRSATASTASRRSCPR